MTNNNETLRTKAKVCNNSIQELINNLTDIQKDVSDYINKSNAIDALKTLNMPINPMIAFDLINMQVKIVSDSMLMGEKIDNLLNDLQDVVNAFNKDLFGDNNAKSASIDGVPKKESGIIKGKFSDFESMLSSIEDLLNAIEEDGKEEDDDE